MSIGWPQALAWRARRQLLDPGETDPGHPGAPGVVDRLGAIAVPSPVATELTVGARLMQPAPGAVERALADGELVAVFAFRGATHLVTPGEGAVYLALRASTRMWERSSWQDYYGLAPSDWPAFRAAVREALDGGPLTCAELAEALAERAEYRHLDPFLTDGSYTLLKPLCWQGDLCFGPARGRQPTFQRLDTHPAWPGLPDVDDAGRRAVVAYLRAYGPTTAAHLRYWLGEGLGVRRAWIGRWLRELAERVAGVDVEGDRLLVLREDVEELLATPCPAAGEAVVRLLPGYDPWVMGPGTADTHVVPATVRPEVSRGANLLLADGVVRGTWSLSAEELVVSWPEAPEGAERPQGPLATATARVAAVLDRPLTAVLDGS